MIQTKTTYNGKTFHRQEWNYHELINFCIENEGKSNGKMTSSERSGDRGFTMDYSYKQGMGLAQNGWEYGLDKIKKAIDKFQVIGKGVSFEPCFQVSGESVDVGRFLSGEVECMQEWNLIEVVSNRVVDVYLNVCTSGGNETNQIVNYGAAVLAIVDFMESSNIRCNLYVYDATSFGNKNYLLCAKIKSAAEPLNLAIASFAMCHPAMLRRVWFKVQEIYANDLMQGYSYGYPTNYPNELLSSEADIINFGSLNDFGFNSFKSEEDSINFVKNKIPLVLNELKVDVNLCQDIFKK